MKKMFYIMLILCFSKGIAFAKDYGVHGKTFEIKEVNILKVLTDILTPDVTRDFQNRYKKEIAQKIYRPNGLNLPRAKDSRKFFYDPSIIVKEDLQDERGRIFVKKGAILNPLIKSSLTKSLIFINGDDKDQLEFALKKKGGKKIILIKGNIIKLMEESKIPLFFDFEGKLTEKFGIKAVPAIVVQRGELLEINEVQI